MWLDNLIVFVTIFKISFWRNIRWGWKIDWSSMLQRWRSKESLKKRLYFLDYVFAKIKLAKHNKLTYQTPSYLQSEIRFYFLTLLIIIIQIQIKRRRRRKRCILMLLRVLISTNIESRPVCRSKHVKWECWIELKRTCRNRSAIGVITRIRSEVEEVIVFIKGKTVSVLAIVAFGHVTEDWREGIVLIEGFILNVLVTDWEALRKELRHGVLV